MKIAERRVNKRRLGMEMEDMAAAFLMERGYERIERNFYSRFGEIDMIARDHEYLVFIEVKYRADLKMGRPEEAVGIKKQRAIVKTAAWYMCVKHIPDDTPCRFDVVAITGGSFRLIKNAFCT